MKPFHKMNEWELALTHRDALKDENYEVCAKIKAEVDKRIETGTIDHNFMNGFKRWDRETNAFYGSPNFEPYNGLFDNYVFKW